MLNEELTADEAAEKEVWKRGARRYINRELSWLQFNSRVFEEALDRRHPLLERVKFLSIYFTNLDEFFMVRVSGLRRQLQAGVLAAPPDGMSPAEQLAAIRESLLPELERVQTTWDNDLLPRLRQEGITVLEYSSLKSKQKRRLREYFREKVFPILTPLAFDPAHPFPHISSLSLNLAVAVRDPHQGERFARIKVPQTVDRLVAVPKKIEDEDFGLGVEGRQRFIWIEDLIRDNLDLLFPGLEILAAHPFRVTRDADLEIEEDEAADLLTAMAEVVGQRHFGSVVRLEIDSAMPERLRGTLERNLDVKPFQVYETSGRLGLSSVSALSSLDLPDLKDQRFKPYRSLVTTTERDIWSQICERDVLVYHPYDSFGAVVNFVRTAAADPDVLAIKQTLYRAGMNSPIVKALMKAREAGKQVSALVELKARFDEENNIGWARALEAAGVHVIYGMMGLKTHAKMCLVVRREGEELCSYVHLSTGNYNPTTAKIYTDLGLFTCDQEIAQDVGGLFNALTGYSRRDESKQLLIAPGSMREEIERRIRREIANHETAGNGRLAFKMNALVDAKIIDLLYEASQAGVEVDLQVRGICCLRPGVPNQSENIRVTSIVGRFLEHTRIYYFYNNGDEEILMGSADLMPRNLDHRVEVLFPVNDPELRASVRDDILFRHLEDTALSRSLQADGDYTPKRIDDATQLMDSQAETLTMEGAWRRHDDAMTNEIERTHAEIEASLAD